MVYGTIHIGECDKSKIILDYIENKEISKIYIIGEPIEIDTTIPIEVAPWSKIEYYVWYYKLIQEINQSVLVILNEVLLKQNRSDLKYNCIRNYIKQTKHRLVFNYYPIIKNREDFMILYDMITDNPFLKEKYKYQTHFENVEIHNFIFDLHVEEITLPSKVEEEYEIEKEKVIGEVKKDADIIPRRLLKFSEKKKPKGYDTMSKIKPNMKICVSQLKVDKYYYNELLNFKGELYETRNEIMERKKI